VISYDDILWSGPSGNSNIGFDTFPGTIYEATPLLPQLESIPAVQPISPQWDGIPAIDVDGVIITYVDEVTDDVKLSDLKRVPDKKIKELGGEEYAREVKGKNEGSKANLYWDKSGRIYTIPNDGGAPQLADTVPR